MPSSPLSYRKYLYRTQLSHRAGWCSLVMLLSVTLTLSHNNHQFSTFQEHWMNSKKKEHCLLQAHLLKLFTLQVLSTSFIFMNSSSFLPRPLTYINHCLSFWSSNICQQTGEIHHAMKNSTECKILHIASWIVISYFYSPKTKRAC